MHFISQYKKEILIGVISSIVFEFLRFILANMPSVGSGIIASFINMPYNSAASVNASYEIIFMSFSMTCSIFAAIFISCILIRKWKKKQSTSTDSHSFNFAHYTLFLLIHSIITFLLCWYVFIFPLQLHASFDLSIELICPYTDSHTIELLRSKWVSMENKDDYLSIESSISSICKENNLNRKRSMY